MLTHLEAQSPVWSYNNPIIRGRFGVLSLYPSTSDSQVFSSQSVSLAYLSPSWKKESGSCQTSSSCKDTREEPPATQEKRESSLQPDHSCSLIWDFPPSGRAKMNVGCLSSWSIPFVLPVRAELNHTTVCLAISLVTGAWINKLIFKFSFDSCIHLRQCIANSSALCVRLPPTPTANSLKSPLTFATYISVQVLWR